MNTTHEFQDRREEREHYAPLARWLLHLFAEATPVQREQVTEADDVLAEYHPRFYHQLPDFILALLEHDAQATVHYAPLLYHLVGCAPCHAAYLELYQALQGAYLDLSQAVQEAVGPTEEEGPGQVEAATIEATPPRMLMRLCQLLIKQAQAIKLQARREQGGGEEVARSLLQQALLMSRHLTERRMRQQALQDLVQVATMDEASGERGQAAVSYSPVHTAHPATRQAGHPARPPGAPSLPAEQPLIHLHAGVHEGSILQQGTRLELHVHGLEEHWRGHYLTITIPLGALLEVVRWSGGNASAIGSPVPVDAEGSIRMLLGETDFQLSHPEDHRVLEALFAQVEMRLAR
jgi:hypothetical protein